MTPFVVFLIAGEVILYFVLLVANRDHPRRPPTLGWFYLFLCVGLFALSGASFLTYVDTARKLKALDVAGIRYVVVRDLLSGLKDMEIGQRGYLLTGREPYAAPYPPALVMHPARVAAVRAAYRDSGDEVRADDLLRLAALKADELARVVALRERGREAEALALIETDLGRNTMDLFRISEGELARKNLAAYDAAKAEMRQVAANRTLGAMAVMAGTVVQMVLLAFGRRRLAPTPDA